MLKHTQPQTTGEYVMQTITKGSHTDLRSKYQTKVRSTYFSPGLRDESNTMWDKFTSKDYLKMQI